VWFQLGRVGAAMHCHPGSHEAICGRAALLKLKPRHRIDKLSPVLLRSSSSSSHVADLQLVVATRLDPVPAR